VVAGPGREVALHIQLQPGAGHGGANKPDGVGLGFGGVGLHGGVAVGGIKSDLAAGPHVDHLDIFILEEVGDLYSGDVVEGIF